MPNAEKKKKYSKIKILRILLSISLPTVCGILIFALLTNFYKKSLFWLAVLYTIPTIFLMMLIPSLLFTIIMERLGLRLLQQQEENSGANKIVYLAFGTGFGILYAIIAEWSVELPTIVISAMSLFIVSLVKMALHIRESKK